MLISSAQILPERRSTNWERNEADCTVVTVISLDDGRKDELLEQSYSRNLGSYQSDGVTLGASRSVNPLRAFVRTSSAYLFIVIWPTTLQECCCVAYSRIFCRWLFKSKKRSLAKYRSRVRARSIGSSGLNINPVLPSTIS